LRNFCALRCAVQCLFQFLCRVLGQQLAHVLLLDLV
jgi:hypothetical protein